MNPNQKTSADSPKNTRAASDSQCLFGDTAFSQSNPQGEGGRPMGIQHCENGHPAGNPDCSICKVLSILQEARRVCKEARKVLDEI